MIWRIVQRARACQWVDQVWVATSVEPSDDPLADFCAQAHIPCYRGSLPNVLSRYLEVLDAHPHRYYVRITGDCPLVMPDIVSYLVEKHFESGADYTAADDCAVGTSGEVINTSALRRAKEIFGHAEYSEYMTWYFRNNAEFFKLNIVRLPEKWIKN